MKLSAFGKVFLAGEYAVLDGWPALVCGIDRAMHASCEPARGLSILHRPSGMVWEGGHAPEELRFAARAVQLCGGRDFRLVYEDDFAQGGLKLGLGGSAAATVIAARACGAPEEEVLARAAAAHFIEQGGSGSGGDVAASALGGVLQVRALRPWRTVEEAMASPEKQAVEATRVPVPASLRLLLAFSGASADTRKLIKSVQRFREGEPSHWRRLAERIAQAAKALQAALGESGPSAEHEVLLSVREGAAAMTELGEAAQAPIMTPALSRICALASAAGAAAKPSGAGGGDCAVVFAFGAEALARVEAALQPEFQTFRIAPAC